MFCVTDPVKQHKQNGTKQVTLAIYIISVNRTSRYEVLNGDPLSPGAAELFVFHVQSDSGSL